MPRTFRCRGVFREQTHRFLWSSCNRGIIIYFPTCTDSRPFIINGGIGGWPGLLLHVRLSLDQSPGRVAQSVTCLATDASLTADPGVVSSIPARSHTFVEIDHEIISKVILLPSAESFKKGCCQ